MHLRQFLACVAIGTVTVGSAEASPYHDASPSNDASSHTQVVSTEQTRQGPGGQSPRDPRNTALPAGTAVLRGRVFAADTARPLRRARVTVNAPELNGESRSTGTSTDGKWEIKDLPAGRYTIQVSRSGYLQLRYGQRRPFEAGKSLQLADKQAIENLDFTLPRMSLITGRVFDETGDPISGVRVFAMRSVYFEGKRRLVPVATGPMATTDDAGQYRILNLAPGSYFVMADLRETWTVNESGEEAVLGYAPTYFPGVTGVTDARRLTVGVGQEASNNDFALIPGRAVTVSGTAVDSQGRPLAGRQLSLGQEWRGPGFMMMSSNSGTSVAADGTFTMRNVAPGSYVLQVRGGVDVNGATVQEGASASIVVGDGPVDNVALQTSSGWSLTGQITTETGAAPNLRIDRIRVTPRPLSAGMPPVGPGGGGPDSGRVRDDWTFAVTGVFGPARLRANLPDGWMLKQILQDGRDVTDAVFEGRSGETLGGLQLVMTNQVNSVSGALMDGKGAPFVDGTVIVFATDSEKWSEDSRFVRFARPDSDGNFSIKGLPPGEYLAAAVDYVEEGMWNDPEYLESIRRYGQKVTLGDADARAVSLKVVTP
jgi:hypothetical protein